MQLFSYEIGDEVLILDNLKVSAFSKLPIVQAFRVGSMGTIVERNLDNEHLPIYKVKGDLIIDNSTKDNKQSLMSVHQTTYYYPQEFIVKVNEASATGVKEILSRYKKSKEVQKIQHKKGKAHVTN